VEVVREEALLPCSDRLVTGDFTRPELTLLHTTQPAASVGHPAQEQALGVLTVVRDVDAVLLLQPDDVDDGLLDEPGVFGPRRRAGSLALHALGQFRRAVEAVGVTGDVAVCAAAHRLPFVRLTWM